MKCIDTDLAIGFLRGNKEAVEFFSKFKGEKELSIMFLTLCELYQGAYLSEKSDKNRELVEDLVENLELIGPNRLSCLIYGKDFAMMRKKGKMVAIMDLLTASICKANDLTIVTRNVSDFGDVPNIKIEQW